MSEALLRKFIYNERIYDTEEFDNIYEDKSQSIYEVVRIMDSVPLFLEEHYERLISSAKILGVNLSISLKEIDDNIRKMIIANSTENHNIKIVINNLKEKELNQYYFLSYSDYPNRNMYEQGVKAITYSAVRKNPQAKVLNKSLRDEVNLLLKKKDCYEALLVNEKGEITEGSRSNTFFIKGENVYTSPSEGVLLGITRQRIISLCLKNNIKVLEVPVMASDLSIYDAIFMSGTSPKVLPISNVDDFNYSPRNNLLLKIMQIYDDEIENYIRNHK